MSSAAHSYSREGVTLYARTDERSRAMRERSCPVCGATLSAAKRTDAVFCTRACKARRTWHTRRDLLALGRAALAP